MGNFFCKVHPLITFAGEGNKSLLKFETASLKGKSKFAYPQGGESGAVRLNRTACSAFQSCGHQAAGMSADFEVYLTELALPMKLIQIEGNRFNVIFMMLGQHISTTTIPLISLMPRARKIDFFWQFWKMLLMPFI